MRGKMQEITHLLIINYYNKQFHNFFPAQAQDQCCRERAQCCSAPPGSGQMQLSQKLCQFVMKPSTVAFQCSEAVCFLTIGGKS